MDYRYRAVVDWIEIQIQTDDTTNFQTVRRAYGRAFPHVSKPFVKAIEANEGGGSKTFAILLHDTERFSDITTQLEKLRKEIPIHRQFSIVGIEIALDVYCGNPVEQAAKFYKFAANPVSENRRMYRDFRGSGKAVPRFESLVRHLSEGWNINIGNKSDDIRQHIYVKDTDTKQGQRKQVEKRARFEITLKGPYLPSQTQDGWQLCKFEQFADYFRLRELKPELEPFEQMIAEASNQIGKRETINRKEGGTRKHSKLTQAAPFNEGMRNALRGLSRRWKSKKSRKSDGDRLRIFGQLLHSQPL